jgi:hypothetical protein
LGQPGSKQREPFPGLLANPYAVPDETTALRFVRSPEEEDIGMVLGAKRMGGPVRVFKVSIAHNGATAAADLSGKKGT